MALRQELQHYIAEHSYRENHDEPFTLASGKKSPYYVNLKKTLLHPHNLKIASSLLLEKIIETEPLVQAVAGLTMGADPLLYTLAIQSKSLLLPIVIRKKTKDHGSRQRAEGLVDSLNRESPVVLMF